LSAQDAENLVKLMVKMTESYPDQPVALIQDDGELKIGVMSIYQPTEKDWCLNPVPVAQLVDTPIEPAA
jgi:hypothetical protein